MKSKRIFIVFLAVFLVIMPLTASAKQLETNTTTTYLYDESTGETIIVDHSDIIQSVDNDLKIPKNLVVREKDNDRDIKILWLYEILDRYDENNHYLNLKEKLVETTFVINSTNQPINAFIETSYSSTWNASGTASDTTSAELNLMIAKVKQEISYGGTLSRSWKSGVRYGSSSSVPALKVYAFTRFIPGTTTNGYAVYNVINDSDGTIVEERFYPRGAIVPCENAWTIEVSEYGDA